MPHVGEARQGLPGSMPYKSGRRERASTTALSTDRVKRLQKSRHTREAKNKRVAARMP